MTVDQVDATASTIGQDARQARLAALDRHGGAAPIDNSGARNDRARTGPVPSANRVAGQLGGGTNKAQRLKDREDILQRMQEDRETYNVRKVPIPTSSPQFAAAAPQSAAVRLQIRCPDTGRSIMTLAFEATNLLSEVLAFAVADFGLGVGVGATIALGYPPWTVLGSEELGMSLGALGLISGATLVVKPSHRNTTQDVAVSVCPRGHAMAALTLQEGSWCDMCSVGLSIGDKALICSECDDSILCQTCCK